MIRPAVADFFGVRQREIARIDNFDLDKRRRIETPPRTRNEATFHIRAAILTSCAGTRFQWEQAERVHLGMSAAEVRALMGEPYMVVTIPNGERWVWSYADVMFSGNVRTFRIDIRNDVVASVPTIPSNAGVTKPSRR